jgi:hypothetical protein
VSGTRGHDNPGPEDGGAPDRASVGDGPEGARPAPPAGAGEPAASLPEIGAADHAPSSEASSAAAGVVPPRLRLAFVAHTGRKIALRAVGPCAGARPVPPRARAGRPARRARLRGAGGGVPGRAEVDAATGEAAIADRAPEGAPARVRFRVDRRGVVALRALDGHPWSEEVPPGRPVFGVPAEILRAAGEGVLELDASGLEARPAEPPPAVPGRGAARDRVVDGGHPPGASRPSVRRRLRPALLLGVLLPVVLAAGGAGWWLLADPARDRAAAEAAGLPAAGPPLPAAPVPAAPPPPKPPEPAVVQDVDRTGPVAGAAGPVVAPWRRSRGALARSWNGSWRAIL